MGTDFAFVHNMPNGASPRPRPHSSRSRAAEHRSAGHVPDSARRAAVMMSSAGHPMWRVCLDRVRIKLARFTRPAGLLGRWGRYFRHRLQVGIAPARRAACVR